MLSQAYFYSFLKIKLTLNLEFARLKLPVPGKSNRYLWILILRKPSNTFSANFIKE